MFSAFIHNQTCKLLSGTNKKEIISNIEGLKICIRIFNETLVLKNHFLNQFEISRLKMTVHTTALTQWAARAVKLSASVIAMASVEIR